MHVISYETKYDWGVTHKSIQFVTLREAVKFIKVLAAQRITYTHIFEE